MNCLFRHHAGRCDSLVLLILRRLLTVSSQNLNVLRRRVVFGFRAKSSRHIPVSVSICTALRRRLRRPREAEMAAARRHIRRRRTWAFNRFTSTPRPPVSYNRKYPIADRQGVRSSWRQTNWASRVGQLGDNVSIYFVFFCAQGTQFPRAVNIEKK